MLILQNFGGLVSFLNISIFLIDAPIYKLQSHIYCNTKESIFYFLEKSISTTKVSMKIYECVAITINKTRAKVVPNYEFEHFFKSF